MAKSHPDLNFSLIVACGERNFDMDCFGKDWCDVTSETNYCFGTDTGRLNCRVKYSLSPEQMRQAYHDTDIYINSSWYEGFGLPTLEAMACGVPVVQADNQGLTGIVVDRKNCLLVPPNNPEKLAEAIVTLVEDDVLRNNLTKNGIETAGEFTKVNQYEMFVEEFEKILCCRFDRALVEAEKRRLSELNLMAGKKALAAHAYDAALNYLQLGIGLLAGNSWQTDYDLTLALYQTATISSN